MPDKPSLTKYHILAALAIVVYSTIELASKYLGPGVSPFTVTAWRFLIGGLVILPFALLQLRKARRALKLAEFPALVFLGFLNVCISMLLLQLSVHFGKASLSAVLVSSNPLFVSIFAYLLLREKLSLFQLLGLALALAGVALLILGEGELAAARYLNLPLSIALGLGAAVTFGFYLALAKKSLQKHGNALTNSVSFIGGAILLFIYNIIARKPLYLDFSWQKAGIMLYLGVMVSGIAYLMYFEAMKGISAARTSVYFFLKPVIASLLAVLLLAETLSILQILAICVIVSGLALSRLQRAK